MALATIKLRPTNENDLDFVLAAECNPENSPFIMGWSLAEHREAFANQNLRHLIIERSVDNMALGYVILRGLEDNSQSIELMRIVITAKGAGYGHQALQLIKRLAFEKLDAHRLWLDFKDYNQRARHLYSSEGFVVEGVLRECLKVGDNFESLVVMSILRSEFQAASNAGTEINTDEDR